MKLLQSMDWHARLNILGLLSIIVSLLVAFCYQLFLHELPCPLCLLQRVGMVLIGMGFLFNICLGRRGLHDAIGLAGCIVTMAISFRQVLLHILPEEAGYGSTFMGLHFYTLALLCAIAAILYYAFTLLFDAGVTPIYRSSRLAKGVAWLFVLVIAANLLSTFLECGLGQCEDNPLIYRLLGF